MRFQLTINQGKTILTAWEKCNYEEMLAVVQNETMRQLQPFLDAKLVPDIIVFENEGTDGFLMTENTTDHIRGSNKGKMSVATTDLELCGHIPSGNMAAYPQLTSYYKGEGEASNTAISAADFSTATVRYGLHSHGQHVQWKESLVHSASPGNQTVLTTPSSTVCNFSAIIPSPSWRRTRPKY